MSERFLSRDDIATMTRTPFRARQVAFFQRNGIRHYIDEHGWPVVTWAAVEGQRDSAQDRPKWKPGLAA